MPPFPPTFSVTAPTTNVASTLKPIQNEVLDEKVPLPTPRPLGSDDTQSLPVAPAPLFRKSKKPPSGRRSRV